MPSRRSSRGRWYPWRLRYFGRLLEAESAEEPHLHHVHFAGIQRAETSERFVQRDEIDIRLAPQDQALIKRDLSPVVAPLLRLAIPGKVDEDSSHQLCGDGKEMRPVLPLDSARVSQPEIGLVHERSGLQGMPRALTCHVAACQPMEFVVNERREAGQSVLIAAVPGEQQLGDITRRSGLHEEWRTVAIIRRTRFPPTGRRSSCRGSRRLALVDADRELPFPPIRAGRGTCRSNPCDRRSPVKVLSLLVACSLTFCSTLLMKASTVDMPAAGPSPHGGAEPERQAPTAAASPATPSHAASARSSTGDWRILAATGARAPTATWPRTISSSRRRASRRGSGCFNCSGGSIPMPTIRCFGRSTPMISAPMATVPVISAICGRTVSSGSPSRCRRISRLIDPATNAASAETFVDVWRSVPTVNDVALTGPDDGVAWLRGPNQQGGYQLDARITTLQEQALGALMNHAQIQNGPPPQLLDDLSSFQRVLFTNHRVRVLADAVRDRHGAAAGSRSAAHAARTGGQGRVPARLRPMPRRAGTVDAPGDATRSPGPVIRFHRIMSQCPRPVDTAIPARFVFAACRPGLARNARTYEIALSVPTASPSGLLPAGTKVRRTSSDPGRALLTGFVGGPAPLDDWEKFDIPGLRGIGKTAPYFHNNSAATLEEVVDHYIEFFKLVQANTAPGAPIPPLATTDGVHFDRRPTPESALRSLRICESCSSFHFV